MPLNSDFQKLSVDGVVTLFELDASKLGAGILRFHGHNHERNDSVIVFRGKEYNPQALNVTGLEMRSDGRASTPTLTLANNIAGVQGAVSAYCLQFSDFAHAKLTVITTLAKYLDAVNFDDGNPTASDECKEQIWFVEQKTSENAQQVTFELSNPIDLEGLKIPVREINNYCYLAMHGLYRSEACGYTGTAMFDEHDKPTDNPIMDKCGGRMKSCVRRFGKNKPLPFGGCPASGLIGV
ncbi:tail protein [Moraxella bovoculi]|uniref:phage minor tail protein L n=1 Tax=Moraxella bovoculi TaxID=386891 RepID=UPI000624BBD0|nr:phage minor tail protein L [Moraxella bovoculi]AKG09362.1 tail protein [Moraxella bovoculi]AKG13188.1 tail protein [Moraxella bovoculi]AKG14220.1 tail protein [Moraxella bovoculi]